ncbi:MAG: divalent-cation tolerance protein CutA [Parashewanella sp.]
MNVTNDSKSGALLVITSLPTMQSAEQLAGDIIKEKLAACVQCYPQVSSFYIWESQLCQDTEVLLHIKCLSTKLIELEHYIQQHHPYDVPQFIALPINYGSTPYLDWMKTTTQL